MRSCWVQVAVLAVALAAAGCGSAGSLTGWPSPAAEGGVPTVASVTPEANGVAPADTLVTVTFSKAMSAGGFEASVEPTVRLGEPRWSEDRRTVTLRPNPGFAPGLIYTVRVRGRDRTGTPMAAEYVWTFTAVAAGGATGEGAPRVAGLTDVGMDPRVFTLSAALLAVGRDTEPADAGSVRAAVRAKVGGLPAHAVAPLTRLFDANASVERRLAEALALSGPPDFRSAGDSPSPAAAASSGGSGQPAAPGQADQSGQGSQPSATPGGQQAAPIGQRAAQTRTAPTPAEGASLGAALARFYADAGLADQWRAQAATWAEVLEAHRTQAPGLLGRAAEYLRAPAYGGHLTILPDLLSPSHRGALVRQGSRAYLVVGVPPGGGISRLALLRAFVRLALDPVRETALDGVARVEPLYPTVRDVAARHGYATWPSVVVESLFETTAIRLALSGDEAQTALRAAYARGLVLVEHFAAQLAAYEGTTGSLVAFYPRMVAAIDLDAERRRLAERRPQ